MLLLVFLSAVIGQKDLFWPIKSQNTPNNHFYCMSIVSIRLPVVFTRLPLVSTRLPLVFTRLHAFTTRLLLSTLLVLTLSLILAGELDQEEDIAIKITPLFDALPCCHDPKKTRT